MSDHHKVKSDLYGRKYCSSCRMHQGQEGGSYKVTKSSQRWICAICTKRMAVSGFSLKGKANYERSRRF